MKLAKKGFHFISTTPFFFRYECKNGYLSSYIPSKLLLHWMIEIQITVQLIKLKKQLQLTIPGP